MHKEAYRIEANNGPVVVRARDDQRHPVQLHIGEGQGDQRNAYLTRREAAALAGILQAMSREAEGESG